MIALKSIEPKGVFPTKFGILKFPNLRVGQIHNDEELYQAVRDYGKAVVVITDPQFSHERLSPAEFEQKWRGD